MPSSVSPALQASSFRISNYESLIKPLLVPCAGALDPDPNLALVPYVNPITWVEYDGTLTIYTATFEAWEPTGSGGPLADNQDGILPPLTVNDKVIAPTQGIYLFFNASASWDIAIGWWNGSSQVLGWHGIKLVGDSPIGTYLRDTNDPGCITNLGCLAIEAM